MSEPAPDTCRCWLLAFHRTRRTRTALCAGRALALLAVMSVALSPRVSGAQATTRASFTVEHTLRAEVGVVTRLALSSPWRPGLPGLDGAAAVLVARARDVWMARADIRSNVTVSVVLDPKSPSVDGANRWLVLNSDGELVEWGSEPVVIAASLTRGTHDVPVYWVALPGTTSAPTPVLRLLTTRGN